MSSRKDKQTEEQEIAAEETQAPSQTETQTEEATVAQQEGQPAVDQFIYCGPNLPRGILNQYTVYRGGVPKHLTQYTEKCPAIQHLFVPIEALTKTIQAVQKVGTAENVWFKQVIGYIKGGVK